MCCMCWCVYGTRPRQLSPDVTCVVLTYTMPCLKINAHLYLPNSSSPTPAGSQLPVRPGDPGCYSLDVLRCYSLLLGSRAVVEEAEALTMGLRVGGAAQKR